MKKSAIILVMLLAFLSGCSRDDPAEVALHHTIILESSTQQIEQETNGTEDYKNMSNCLLLVNNNDISKDCYVWIDQTKKFAEIPLLAILEELGADIAWQNNIVTIVINNNTIDIDTTKEDFGILIPPGTEYGVRKVVDKEILLDSATLNVLLRHLAGLHVYVDYDSSVIYVR